MEKVLICQHVHDCPSSKLAIVMLLFSGQIKPGYPNNYYISKIYIIFKGRRLDCRSL